MVNIFLRELEVGDLPRVNAWRNDPDVIRLLGANFMFIGLGIDQKWFENYVANRAAAIRLAIIVADANLCIGLVNLTSIHAINRSAEFSIMLGDKAYWSQGVGYQATLQILRHAFDDLNLHRIHLTVLEDNTRARRLYQKIGFKEEGVKHEAVYKAGKFLNVVELALLKRDFKIDE